MNHRILSTIGILTLLIAIPAHAAIFQQGDNVGVTLPVDDNLYIAGSNVTVNTTVAGDIIAGGRTVKVRGDVSGNVEAGGGDVTIDAPVAKSVRVAGGTVTIGNDVGSDLIIVGGQILVESGAVIEGDMIVFGGTVTMDGRVKGKLKAYGGEIVLAGNVDGPAEISAETVTVNGTIGGETTLAATTLSVGTNATLKKNVRYWTKNGTADFGTALEQGKSTAVYDATLARTSQEKASTTAKWTSMGIVTIFGIYSLLTSALLLILFLLLGRTAFKHAGDRLRHAPWWSLLIGFLYFAATPIFILLLFVTIIGIPVAFFTLALYIFSYVFGTVITAILLTRWIEATNHKHWSLGIFFLVSFGVLLGIKLLFFIPILGWIARAILLFMAFGALISVSTAHWKRVSPSHH